MNARNKLLGLLLVLVLALFCGFAVSCGEDDVDDTPEIPVKTEWPEAGVYYFTSDSDECTLTLNVGDSFSLYVDGKYQSGTYTLKDSTLTLKFNAEGKKDIVADYQGSSIALTYEGSGIRFLKKITYTVTFQTNGGSVTESQTVINGKFAAKPMDPVRDGYVFVGWYADEAFTTPYAFGSEPVLKGTTLYARWSEESVSGVEYEVSLDANYEGAEALRSVTTVGGKLFDLPTLKRDGYTFGGWWFGSDNGEKLSHQYLDGTEVKGGDTLYALWISAPVGSKLPAPVVNVTPSLVSWGAVSGARSYLVKVVGPDGELLLDTSVSATSVKVPFADYVEGQYEVTVIAQADSGEANNSQTVRYFVNKALAKVSLFDVVEPSMLVFGGVENAEKYLISVVCGNAEHDHVLFDNGSSKTFSFANCAMTEAGISFTVTAVAEGYASSVSETFTYVRNLDKVTGLRVDEASGNVVWNEVAGAENYMVSVLCGNASHNHGFVNLGSATSVSIKECTPCKGGIVVKVYPKTAGYNSPEAAELVYNKTTLGTPSNLLLKDTVLSWSSVEGADKYEVVVNGTAHEVTATELDLSALVDAVEGSAYTVKVRAIGDTESLYSDELVAYYFELNGSLSYGKGVVTWAPVIGADYYEVQVNDGEIVKIENGVFCAAITLTKAGNNAVKVRFADGKVVSDWVQTDVYAHRVVFDSLGGSSVAVQYKAVGDPIVLPEPEKAGYSFVDWYNVPGGPLANGNAYTDDMFNKSSELVLYGYYKANKYDVVYNYGVGGSGSLTTDEVFYEKDYQLTVPTATDVAGAFGGWFSAPYGMGVQYTDESGKSLVPWSHLEGKELYAFWIDETLSFTLTRVNGKDAYAVSKGSRISLVSEITVPATYKGLPVAFVAGNAFQGCSNLTVINLPATIEQISLISPFAGCSSLAEVNVYNVEGVNAPRFSSVDGVLFDNGTPGATLLALLPLAKGGTYRVPANVTEIPEGAFVGSSVTKVIIPVSVTRIGREAFANCSKLVSVVFEAGGDQSLTIGTRAFMGCTSLSRITLPARLTDIKLQRYVIRNGNVITDNTEYVFAGCYSLGSINIAQGNDTYKSIDGALYSKDGRTLILAPASVSGSFVVPEGTRSIAQGAFIGCTGLTEVVLPGTLSLVGECAFYGLPELVSVKLTGKAIDDQIFAKYSFRDCKKLSEIAVGDESRLTDLGEGALMGCTSIESFTVSATMSTVGVSAFEGCSSLETVTFEESTKELSFGSDAFKNCTSLTTVNLPANVTKIPGVFSGCTSLAEVNVVPGSDHFVSEEGVVYDINKTEIVFFPRAKTGEFTVPATVTTISNGVFQNVSGLTKLTINNTVTYIGDYAFDGAEIPEIEFVGEATGTLTIGDNAFRGAELGTLTLPAHTVSIGNEAFREVEADAVIINEGVASIGDYAFYDAEGLEVSVPASVKTVGAYAFSGEYNSWYGDFYGPEVLLTVEGSCLTTIGDYAFYANSYVEDLVIPASVVTIGQGAFSECGELVSVTFVGESSLKTLGAQAFEACGELTKITLPKSVTLVGSRAFYDSGLVEVVFEDGGTEPLVIGSFVQVYNWGDLEDYYGNVFEDCYDLEKVVLPTRLTELRDATFKYAGYYSDELTVTIEGTGEVQLTTIGAECFANSALVGFTVPKSVRNLAPAQDPYSGVMRDRIGIGNKAFYALGETLATLTFEMGGKDALTIGNDALERARLLTSLELPARLAPYTSYTGDVIAPLANGARVLTSCDKLASVTVENAEGAYYASDDGVLITADGKELVYYPVARAGSYEVSGTVTKIHERAFYNAVSLTELTFKGGTEDMTIGNSAFAYCEALTALVLPNNVISIGETAFYGCYDLESLTLSSSLTVFKPGMVTDCDSLAAINVGTDGVGEFYSSVDGVLYNGDKTALVMYPGAKTDTELTVDANVKIIFASAFAYNETLEKVVLPEGLVEINSFAFDQCSALTEVNIPSTVQLIGSNAFRRCTALTTVTFAQEGNDPLIISDYAFQYTRSLVAANIPSRIYSIGSYAFGDSAVPTVTFGEGASLVSIGDYAFSKSDITAIAIPAGTVSIGNNAFFDCPELSEVTIGEGLLSVGDHAFAGCSELISVSFPASLKTLGESVFFHYEYGEYTCSKLESVIFAPGCSIEVIPAGTFAYTALKSITIPASVKVLEGSSYPDDEEPSTFYEVSTLKNVYFEKGSVCSEIGDYVFAECRGLKNIELPTSVSTIGQYAFNYCTALESIVIPETVTNLGKGTFWGCWALEEVELNTKATALPENMFYDCESLTKIIIPASVSTIGSGCFKGTALESFEVDPKNGFYKAVDGILYTADGTGIVMIPSNKVLVNFVVPKEVTSISDGLFKGMSSLETLVFEDGRTEYITIGESAFYECVNLRSVVLPDLVASIGDDAFYYCSSLAYVALPTDISKVELGYDVFYGCYRLVEVYNRSTTEILPGDYETFGGVATYAIRVFSDGVSNYAVDDNGYATVTEGEEKYLVNYFGESTDAVVPDGVTAIYYAAFADRADLTSVVIPASVKVIGAEAFAGCEELSSVVLTAGLTEIADQAFYGCESLTEITFPEGLESIGYQTFYGTDLRSVKFPASLKSIDESAFMYSSITGNVSIPATLESIGGKAFYGCGSITFLVASAEAPEGWASNWCAKNYYGDSYPVLWGFSGEEITYTFVVGEGATEVAPIVSAAPIDMPAGPTREGYVFLGWYDNEACEGEALSNGYYNSVKNTIYASYMTEAEYVELNRGKTMELPYIINVGDTLDCKPVSGECPMLYYSFTVTESGKYAFYYSCADGSKKDTRGYLYDSEGNYIDDEDYSAAGDYYHFYLTCELEAGKTYIFGAKEYYGSTAEFLVTLEKLS